VDRLEVVVRVLAVVLAGFVVVLALRMGGVARQHLANAPTAGTWVTAVVQDDVTALATYSTDQSTVSVPATWRMPDGTKHTGVIQVLPPEAAGAHEAIWVDPSGTPADPPLTPGQIAGTEVLVVITCVVFGLLAVAGLWFLARWRLNAARYARWARDWARIEPQWTERRLRG
jgi:hypothetical protein